MSEDTHTNSETVSGNILHSKKCWVVST